MENHHQLLLLRTSYWLGAIIDAIVAIQLLLPSFWASFDQLTTYTPSTAFNFALGIASSLMFGWTFLLIWADRKPVERKGVLLLTTFPVIFGLAANNIFAIISGLRPLQSTLPELLLQIGLACFFIFSYLNAKRTTV
jgi:hypothetical protein